MINPFITQNLSPPPALFNHLGWALQIPSVAKVTKLAAKLHAHSVQYAYKLVSTRRALEKTVAASHHPDQEWRTASHPPDPH